MPSSSSSSSASLRASGHENSAPLPVVVDDREHLLVDEAPRADERLPFGLVELLTDEEVVGDERGAEHHVISGSASASAIAR
jgi:hypothetical protein